MLCYIFSDSPHRRRRTNHSITFEGWRRCALSPSTQFPGPWQVFEANGVSIGSSVFVGSVRVPNTHGDRQTTLRYDTIRYDTIRYEMLF